MAGINHSDDFIDSSEEVLRACYPTKADTNWLDLCLTVLVVEQQNLEPRLAPSLTRKLVEALVKELQNQYARKSVTKCPVCERLKKEVVFPEQRKQFLREIGHMSKKRAAPAIVSVLRAFRAAPQEFTYKDIVDLGNNTFKESTVRSVFSVLQVLGEVRSSSPAHAGAMRTFRYKTDKFGKGDIWKLEDGTGEVQWQYFQTLTTGKKDKAKDTEVETGKGSGPKTAKPKKKTE